MNQAEKDALVQELHWYLEHQVYKELESVMSIIRECSRYFPLKTVANDESLVKPENFVLSNPQTDRVKCVVTLLGDIIYSGEVSFKLHKNTSSNFQKTSISPERPWRLKQLQDVGNLIGKALSTLVEADHSFTSIQQVLKVLEGVMEAVTSSHARLAIPRRRTLAELCHHGNMSALQPTVGSDSVLSFYVHASRLVLAVYELNAAQAAEGKLEIRYKHQIECSVPWLSDVLVLLNLAQQACLDLRDKLLLFAHYNLPTPQASVSPSLVNKPPPSLSATPMFSLGETGEEEGGLVF